MDGHGRFYIGCLLPDTFSTAPKRSQFWQLHSRTSILVTPLRSSLSPSLLLSHLVDLCKLLRVHCGITPLRALSLNVPGLILHCHIQSRRNRHALLFSKVEGVICQHVVVVHRVYHSRILCHPSTRQAFHIHYLLLLQLQSAANLSHKFLHIL